MSRPNKVCPFVGRCGVGTGVSGSYIIQKGIMQEVPLCLLEYDSLLFYGIEMH
jgi:hypothetical protein